MKVTFQQSAVTLIVIAVLAVLIAEVVHMVIPVIVVGLLLLITYKVLTGNGRRW